MFSMLLRGYAQMENHRGFIFIVILAGYSRHMQYVKSTQFQAHKLEKRSVSDYSEEELLVISIRLSMSGMTC